MEWEGRVEHGGTEVVLCGLMGMGMEHGCTLGGVFVVHHDS